MAFESKRMMGGLCFMVDGKMCVGVVGGRLMARVGPDAYDAALEEPGCGPMDFTGREMRGYVFVDGAVVSADSQLDAWIGRALAFNPLAKASAKKKRS